jgi:3-deoxy-D-manno-octulosonate 8-phosphate phosphatase (KDO 8-P phosphatase)
MAAASRMRELSPRIARRLQLLVLDVDGVLTDGALYFGARGEMLKAFHVRDGHGIKLLQAAGVQIAVISGRRSPAVLRRCRDLGIRHVIQGAANKSQALDVLMRKTAIDQPGAIACVGDDTPDIPLFARVGLSFAVADGHPLARAAAHRVTTLPGGRGAVREICDLLLAARSLA